MQKLRIAALLLALCLLLGGCDFLGYLDEAYGYSQPIAYQDMTYTRPDMAALESKLYEACDAAATSVTAGGIMNQVYEFYNVYDDFLTNWYLADIRYSADLTDGYWEAEYAFCSENVAKLDAALETLYRTLAVCPLRAKLEEDYFGQDFFLDYEGEQTLDETYVGMLEQEASLESQYYALADQALAVEYGSDEYYEVYGAQMAELLAQLVLLRQEMAAYLGFESYTELAYDGYYYRDYTPAQAETYLEALGSALCDSYASLPDADFWDIGLADCSTEETFAYLKEAAGNMGGKIQSAFELLESAGLYDIGYGPNKYDSSFSLYLWSYGEPFIFMNPYMEQADKLVLAHEFGHFANDYVCGGSYAGTDVAEVHSQAFEYLSLCYTENAQELIRYKMADSLCVFVECAAYALFEHRLYALAPEQVTAENIAAIYEQVGRQFGLDSWEWDSRNFVSIVHFFTEPMYMVSYAVSNDLALQFWQMEQAQAGSGLALYEKILQSEDSYIIAFANTYGLESPFDTTRPDDLAKTFQNILTPENPT